ncbi:hypothetical protein MIMGU_mgv1a015757mg [Erythranthe guttata]|uniref:EF-hand domain-containing protein n=1 Tax=Erythranthe guttata TaxID=4155 RepID=A0A022QBG3_ERYGU|nr:hypothetical protein MIMGU_mgv1a015757mg [Erythranthe guttata]
MRRLLILAGRVFTSACFKRIFKNLDKNNSGRVTVHDLHHLLRSSGICNTTTVEDLEELVGPTTSLDYAGFLFFYDAMAFKVFDLNNDGFISSDELQTVLSRIGLLDEHDCKEMILAYDRNRDGVLDFGEFKDMMSVRDLSGDGLEK